MNLNKLDFLFENEEGEEKNAEQDTINDDLLIDKGKPIIIDRQIITESGKILLKD